jgi:hypothetical protein
VLESPACSCVLQMIPTPRATSQPSELISYVYSQVQIRRATTNDLAENSHDRIRWQDRKVTDCKHTYKHLKAKNEADSHLVGYRWTRALPNHHIFILPRRSWYLRGLRCYRHGLIQQCKAVAPGDRQIRHRRCQQAPGGQQERYVGQESRGVHSREGT